MGDAWARGAWMPQALLASSRRMGSPVEGPRREELIKTAKKLWEEDNKRSVTEGYKLPLEKQVYTSYSSVVVYGECQYTKINVRKQQTPKEKGG
jgi:hypothetical protein